MHAQPIIRLYISSLTWYPVGIVVMTEVIQHFHLVSQSGANGYHYVYIHVLIYTHARQILQIFHNLSRRANVIEG